MIPFAERITAYGKPDDAWIRQVDTYAPCSCGEHPKWKAQRLIARLPVDSIAIGYEFTIREVLEP